MFTEKELTAYRNIKAPDELRQKITKTQKKTYKRLYFISAVAACFIFIMSGVILGNQNNIVINGQELKSSIVFYDTASRYGRTVSSSISVPVEIKTSRKTKISVSEGLISIDGLEPTKELTISSKEIIWWEIELEDSDNVFEMKISDKNDLFFLH